MIKTEKDIEERLEYIEKYKYTMIDSKLSSIYPTDTDLEDELLDTFDENLREKYRDFNNQWLLNCYEYFTDCYEQLVIDCNKLKLYMKRIKNIDKMFGFMGCEYGCVGSVYPHETGNDLNEKTLTYMLKTIGEYREIYRDDGLEIDRKRFENLVDKDEYSSTIKEKIDIVLRKIDDVYDEAKKIENDDKSVVEMVCELSCGYIREKYDLKIDFKTKETCSFDYSDKLKTIWKYSLEYYYILLYYRISNVNYGWCPRFNRNVFSKVRGWETSEDFIEITLDDYKE